MITHMEMGSKYFALNCLNILAPHFLMAPKVTPLSRCFLRKKVNMATGKRKRKVPAAMVGQSLIPDPNWEGMKGGAVWAPLFVIIKARAYSFQAVIKQKTAVAAMPVADWGSTIFQKA